MKKMTVVNTDPDHLIRIFILFFFVLTITTLYVTVWLTTENGEESRMKTVQIIEIIKRHEDYPIRDESYLVGRVEDCRYFFAWGPEYPYTNELPAADVLDGESGISYHATADEALEAMKEAVEAVEINIIDQIETHLHRLGLHDLGPADSVSVYADEPGTVRLADDHGEWIGPAEVALERLAAQKTLSWEEFWEIFRD